MAVSLPDRLDRRRALLVLLAQGGLRDAARLAHELLIPRTELDAGIEWLRLRGLDIALTEQDGVRLGAPLELLDAERIVALLSADAARQLHALEVLFEVDSTNTHLLRACAPPAGRADVALTELQHSGRGRHGRRWVSPFGASLALSVGWTFRPAERADSALSLAVGVAVSRALDRMGARNVVLKWPNDIWFQDGKIGGVLVEAKSDGAAAHVVIGVGLNLVLSDESRREIGGRPNGSPRPAALSEACPAPFSRNGLAAALLEELLSMLREFEREGFAAFRENWRSLDALAGRPVRVLLGDAAVEGIARGVDEDGALLMETDGRLQRFVSGEASLRLIEGGA